MASTFPAVLLLNADMTNYSLPPDLSLLQLVLCTTSSIACIHQYKYYRLKNSAKIAGYALLGDACFKQTVPNVVTPLPCSHMPSVASFMLRLYIMCVSSCVGYR